MLLVVLKLNKNIILQTLNQANQNDKTPSDAILNPLNELIDEKESEILELKNGFLDDDTIAENVIISKIVADDFDANKFQMLYIKNNIYYLIHYAETGKINIINTYNADLKPDKLLKDTTLYKFIVSDVDKTINPTGISTGSTNIIVNEIVDEMLKNINEFINSKDKTVLKNLLSNADDSIKEILKEHSIELAEKVADEISSKILKKLENDKEPSAKLLANYLNNNGLFFLEYETRKRYMKTDKGFKEISIEDVSAFFNEHFGYNEISENQSKKVLGFITRKIEKDYNLIQFSNGTINTIDEIFYKNKFYDNVLPKIALPFPYVEDAELEFKETDLYKENHAILKSNRWEWNEELFYKCVGACGMAINEIEKLIVIVGDPNCRKSTLLTLLKRIFNYSEVKLQTIAENPRFQLLPCIDKDINIDDDLQSFRIDKIGFLNTFVSGNGGEVEIKGENIGAKLTAETTPIIVGASNTLPSISGDGFERRLILILAENEFTEDESKKSYIQDIKNGKRDDEIALMFSYSLQQYFKIRDYAVVNDIQKKAMIDEWAWKSYPAKKGAELMFIDEFKLCQRLDELKSDDMIVGYTQLNKWKIQVELKDVDLIAKYGDGGRYYIINTYTPVKKVNQKFKEFYKIAYDKKKIFKESKKASTRVIKSAMENAGFYQTNRRFMNDYETWDNEKVYEDCIELENAIGLGDWKNMF